MAVNALAGMFLSGPAEWFTPPGIVAGADAVLGGIDLDPCASLAKPHHVPAGTVFTSSDDGLSRPWSGAVYMNPPYGNAVRDWITKAEREVMIGNADAVLALVAARPDARWFQPLFRYPLAFIVRRVRFLDATGTPHASPAFPSALALITRCTRGDMVDDFAAAFSHAGPGPAANVVLRWNPV